MPQVNKSGNGSVSTLFKDVDLTNPLKLEIVKGVACGVQDGERK